MKLLEDEMPEAMMRQVAPSVFAEHPMDGVSDKYVFIPTPVVMDFLRQEGFYPARAQEMRVKSPEGRPFAQHKITFNHRDSAKMKVGDSRVNMILINSHDRSKAYSIYGGLFRLVCSNGMVVSNGTFKSMTVKHMNTQLTEIIAGSRAVLARSGLIVEQVNAFTKRKLTPIEQEDFAARAMAIRYGPNPPISIEQALSMRRPEDDGDSLWKVFNRVQENMTRGGIRGETRIHVPTTGETITRYVTTQPIRNFRRDTSVNQGLWEIAESYINN